MQPIEVVQMLDELYQEFGEGIEERRGSVKWYRHRGELWIIIPKEISRNMRVTCGCGILRARPSAKSLSENKTNIPTTPISGI